MIRGSLSQTQILVAPSALPTFTNSRPGSSARIRVMGTPIDCDRSHRVPAPTSSCERRAALCTCLSSSDGEELPRSVDAFELVITAIVELEACPSDQHWDRGGDQQFSRGSSVEHTGCDMHRDSCDVAA